MVGKDAVDDLFDVVGRTGDGDATEEDDDKEPVEIILRVHVQPGAGRTEVIGRHGDALKVRVAAPPEGGRANQAVAELVATMLGVAKSTVILESGATSASKQFRVAAIEPATLRRLLAGAGPTPKPRPGSRGGNAGTGRGVR